METLPFFYRLQDSGNYFYGISDQLGNRRLNENRLVHVINSDKATGNIMTFWRIPLDVENIEITRGVVHILDDRCKGCGYCIEFCPKEILEFSTRFNQKGYHPPRIKDPDACVNCHYCEIICPEFAIYSVEAGSESSPN